MKKFKCIIDRILSPKAPSKIQYYVLRSTIWDYEYFKCINNVGGLEHTNNIGLARRFNLKSALKWKNSLGDFEIWSVRSGLILHNKYDLDDIEREKMELEHEKRKLEFRLNELESSIMKAKK